MAFDAAFFVKIGSATLWVLVGLALAARGTRLAHRALGVLLVGYAGPFVVNNLNSAQVVTQPQADLLNLPLNLSAFAGALWLIIVWVREDGPRARLPLRVTAALAAVLATYIALSTLPGGDVRIDGAKFRDRLGVPLALGGLLDIISHLRAEAATLAAVYVSARAAVDHQSSRPDAAIAIGLGVFAVYSLAASIVYPSAEDPPVPEAVWILYVWAATLLLATLWLVAAARGGGRRASVVAMAFPAIALAGLLVFYLARVPADLVAEDPTGSRGVVRTLAWIVLVTAIVRHDLLGLGLRKATVSRGSIAAGALATLFIVAQVAQNFFSAEYGLLTGGIVAGTFLFAAQPLQRAMERVVSPSGPAPAAPRPSDERAEAIYVDALRIALKDRRLSREEELHLAELGERLGIPARKALALRHQVESEAR